MPTFTVSTRLPVPPPRVYDAWLDPAEHGAMTGAPATVEEDRFTAWDGYIQGEYLEREPGRRIVMAWRTADFAEGAPSARVVVELIADGAGTLVTLTQHDTPEDQGDRYVSGWEDFYFTPMGAYFTG